LVCFSRSLRTSWLVVGMDAPLSLHLGKGDYYKGYAPRYEDTLPYGNRS
jgi:hypothetical protein